MLYEIINVLDPAQPKRVKFFDRVVLAVKENEVYWKCVVGVNVTMYPIEGYQIREFEEPMVVVIVHREYGQPNRFECSKIVSVEGDIRLVKANGLTYTFDSVGYYIEEVIFRKESK